MPAQVSARVEAIQTAESAQRADCEGDWVMVQSTRMWERFNKLMKSDLTPTTKFRIYATYHDATNKFRNWLHGQGRARGQGLCVKWDTLEDIKSLPHVARYLARQTDPDFVVPRIIEELLDMAIRGRKKHGAEKKDSGDHHRFAIDMLEEVQMILSPCFERNRAVIHDSGDASVTGQLANVDIQQGDSTVVNQYEERTLQSYITTIQPHGGPTSHAERAASVSGSQKPQFSPRDEEAVGGEPRRQNTEAQEAVKTTQTAKRNTPNTTVHDSTGPDSDKSSSDGKENKEFVMAKLVTNEQAIPRPGDTKLLKHRWKPMTSSEVAVPKLVFGKATIHQPTSNETSVSQTPSNSIPAIKLWLNEAKDDKAKSGEEGNTWEPSLDTGKRVPDASPARQEAGQAEEPSETKKYRRARKRLSQKRRKELARSMTNIPPELAVEVAGVERPGPAPSNLSSQTDLEPGCSSAQSVDECRLSSPPTAHRTYPPDSRYSPYHQRQVGAAGNADATPEQALLSPRRARRADVFSGTNQRSRFPGGHTAEMVDAELEEFRRDPQAFLSRLCPGAVPGEIKRFTPSRESDIWP